LEINHTDGPRKVNVGGIIDRIDEKSGQFRVIDYKSGKPATSFTDIAKLVDSSKTNRPKEILQTLVYCLAFLRTQNETIKVKPGLYALRLLYEKSFSTEIKYQKSIISDVRDVEEDLDQLLIGVLESIFDLKKPFKKTGNLGTCMYCEFRSFCRR